MIFLQLEESKRKYLKKKGFQEVKYRSETLTSEWNLSFLYIMTSVTSPEFDNDSSFSMIKTSQIKGVFE